jgi:citrate lyase beta subunit
MAAGLLPPFFGIRIKSLRDEAGGRRGRTLDIFLTTLSRATGGRLPDNFVVTLPKVSMAEEVSALVSLFDILEAETDLAPGSLKLEIMVETPQALVDPLGRLHLPRLIAAAGGRCVAAHFGAYDFTASLNVVAAYQHMGHPACDFARLTMQTALADTGVRLSDGATNLLPIEPHRAPKDGAALRESQIAENRQAVSRAWRAHYANIRRSLTSGLYQGWDLHPSQLPVRYAATYAFFLEQQDAVGQRLKTFVEKAARATEQGGNFDDAATGQGMLNFFLRGINCGAFDEEDAARAGLSVEEIRTRSFGTIVENRCR